MIIGSHRPIMVMRWESLHGNAITWLKDLLRYGCNHLTLLSISPKVWYFALSIFRWRQNHTKAKCAWHLGIVSPLAETEPQIHADSIIREDYGFSLLKVSSKYATYCAIEILAVVVAPFNSSPPWTKCPLPIDHKVALIQIRAWRRTGDKSLPEPMLTQFHDTFMRH